MSRVTTKKLKIGLWGLSEKKRFLYFHLSPTQLAVFGLYYSHQWLNFCPWCHVLKSTPSIGASVLWLWCCFEQRPTSWLAAGLPLLSNPPNSTHQIFVNYGISNTRSQENSQKMFQAVEEKVFPESIKQNFEGVCKQLAHKRSWTRSNCNHLPPLQDWCHHHTSNLSNC